MTANNPDDKVFHDSVAIDEHCLRNQHGAFYTSRIMSGISPSSAFFHGGHLFSTDVPSTAEIIQKCLTVNPFELKFREANRRISQSQDGLDQNGLGGSSLTLPTSAGISMLKLSSSLNQSPTIFSNINLLSADLDFTRKLRESGFMNSTKTEGNRTPCTADVLNAVLDMNMNHQQIAAVAAAANGNNHMSTIPFSTAQQIISNGSTSIPQVTTTISEPNFAFPSSSISNNKIPTPPAASIPSSIGIPMSTMSTMSDISSQSTSLTSLQPPPVNITTSFSTGHLSEMDKSDSSMLNVDTSWEQDIKPDISNGPPLKRMATDPLVTQNYCASEGSPFSNSSNVSRRSETPTVKTTRKYHSRCTDGTTPRSGRGRRSITSEMPADERRQTILERNKAAAVRYRKRKKEEHDEMITRVNLLEQDKGALATQNSVLRREVERLTELLKLRDSRCVCHAAQLGANSQSLLSNLPPEPAEQQHAFNLHMGRQ